MISRRDIVFGGGLLAAAAGASALTPRRHVILLPAGGELEKMIPKRFGGWETVPSAQFVLPKEPGSLSDRLYNQTLTRLYQSAVGIPVMVVMAYGQTQNDLLQLHRPEVCYASVGFQISGSAVDSVGLRNGASLPVRELVATNDTRVEPIVYWTRIGDNLPTSGNEQRVAKLKQQIAGIIPDGILVRMSTVADPSKEVFTALRGFAAKLVEAVAPANRALLIGSTLGNRLKQS